MAPGASGVTGNSMERGELRAGVARCAGRGRSDASGPVRAMTSLATGLDPGVRSDGLVRVARAARRLRDRRPGVRLVAARAVRVTGRGARLLFRVAGAAAGRRVGSVRGRSVAARAIRVAAVGRCGTDLGGMACGAHGRRRRRPEVVALVAADAGHTSPVRPRVETRDGRVATCARSDRGLRVSVRDMAARARALVGVRDMHGRVAAFARARGVGRRMGRVAVRADRVGRGARRRERRLGSVAPDACRHAAGDEVVGFVAPDARIVARGLWSRWLRMAGWAGLHSGYARRVRVVAIEAPLRACVVGMRGRSLRVARGAILDLRERIGVHLVTLRAVGRAVLVDLGEASLGLGVAANASGRGSIWGERMALKTVNRGAEGRRRVRVARLLFMAPRARRTSRALEPFSLVIVAVLARRLGLADMRSMPGARPVLGPRRGDELGRYVGASIGQFFEEARDRGRRDGHCGQDAPEDPTHLLHGPPPWHARHGTSRNLFSYS